LGGKQGVSAFVSKPDAVNPEHQKHATDLLLETFREKLEKGEIDLEALKKMGFKDPDDARRWLKNREDLRNRGVLDRVRGSGSVGGPLTGPTRSGTGTNTSTDAVIDPSLRPPRELQSDYEDFTRKLAQPPK
jgi:hypothetical protein